LQKSIDKLKDVFTDLRQRLSVILSKIPSVKQSEPIQTDEEMISSTARIAKPRLPKTKPIRRRSRHKVYRLKGYTTVAKVNRKRQAERQQRLLRRALLFIIVIFAVILMYNYINPFKNIAEFYRFIGISSISDIITGTTTGPSTTIESETETEPSVEESISTTSS